MFRTMDTSAKNLISNVIQLVYYMNGSIQYDDMMWRTPLERSLMEEFVIDKDLEEKIVSILFLKIGTDYREKMYDHLILMLELIVSTRRLK